MFKLPPSEWTTEETAIRLSEIGLEDGLIDYLCREQKLDGKTLLVLNDTDFGSEPLTKLSLGDKKALYIFCKRLQKDNGDYLNELGFNDCPTIALYHTHSRTDYSNSFCDTDRINSPIIDDGIRQGNHLPAEKTKAFLSFCYLVAATWITAFVMVIVHDRVPDMKKYPPLPDIFLDNVPHIPWAFDMCEVTGTVLFTVWLLVLFFHKHRFILMRRFCALSGTVFLLRCVTMLITSLSVPGAHLQCEPRNFTKQTSIFADLATKLSQAYVIWRGAGLSIQGVRTCGDYMFSGHTVALTMLNFFITEYTPRRIYYLHTLTWMMNMFGIFFILAAHEHYSIDVFVAFYITSRLFLYYHTLSNNQALMQQDSTRTKVWFPMFSYFESSVDCIVPNEYETPSEIAYNLIVFAKNKLNDLKELNALVRVRSGNLQRRINGNYRNSANREKDAKKRD